LCEGPRRRKTSFGLVRNLRAGEGGTRRGGEVVVAKSLGEINHIKRTLGGRTPKVSVRLSSRSRKERGLRSQAKGGGVPT